MKQINETETITYRVVHGKDILLESVSKTIAENFVSKLDKTVQEKAQILPVTGDGKQILLG